MRFRGAKAQAARQGHVAAWLRMGRARAEKVECGPCDEKRFRAALDAIRLLATEPAPVWRPRLAKLCAEAGAVVAFVPEIPRAGACGATKRMTRDKALILLSLEHRPGDRFWLSFFHEGCHVLKRSQKTVFCGCGDAEGSPDGQEANRFAGDALVPPQRAGRLPHLKGKVRIVAFAASIGTAPGIAVGRMQHDDPLLKSRCNDLKRKCAWSAPSGKETGIA